MTDPAGTPEKEPPRPGLVAGIAIVACGVLILLVLALYRFLGGFNTISSETGKWNDFGVYFGGVLGPLLSALTLAAVVYTLVLQIRQLAASDKEKAVLQGRLDAATTVQEDTAKGLSDQLKTSREQAAIATFFEMVRLHHEIVNGIHYANVSGRASLQFYFETSFTTIYQQSTRATHMTRVEFDNFVANVFNANAGANIGHYFRNLYRIYKYVDESEAIPDKLGLTGIIRAQLTRSELALVFYNGVSNDGRKFKPLLEKYAVFENLNKNALIQPDSRNDYEDGAWGDNLNTL